jgi:hypothetical protein
VEFVYGVVRGLIEQSRYDEALKALDRYAGMIKDQRKTDDIMLWIHNEEAKPHVQKKEWAEAIAVFERGVKRYPEHARLKQNLKYYQSMAKK